MLSISVYNRIRSYKTVTPCVLLDNSEGIFGYYKLNVLTLARITTIMYDFLPVLIFRFQFFYFFIFLSSLLDYWFPYVIRAKKQYLNYSNG